MKSLKQKFIFVLVSGIIIGSSAVAGIITKENRIERQKNQISNPAYDEKNKDNTTKEDEEKTEDIANKKLFPDNRMVALYGSPGTPVLGSLGEQGPEDAVARAKQVASEYQQHSQEKIIPAFEIITTIAASEATDNGDYSRELSIEKIRPWIDAAKENDVYVILDLQPGLSDFTSQAKLYEEILAEPNVGLALDPEWRLKPGQKHMKQVGSVSAEEINQTAEWLADLCKRKELPQKLFLLHQFKLSMIENREKLNTNQPELAWLIQMDGLGAQNIKQDTWRNIQGNLPANIFLGWKNFIDEDKPMLTPQQTMQIAPVPFYVSYQ